MSEKIYVQTEKASPQIDFLIQHVVQTLIEDLHEASTESTAYSKVGATLAVFYSSFAGMAAKQIEGGEEKDKQVFEEILAIARKKEFTTTMRTIREVFLIANKCNIFVNYEMSMNYELYLKQKEVHI